MLVRWKLLCTWFAVCLSCLSCLSEDDFPRQVAAGNLPSDGFMQRHALNIRQSLENLKSPLPRVASGALNELRQQAERNDAAVDAAVDVAGSGDWGDLHPPQ